MAAVVKFPVVMVDPCGCHGGFPVTIHTGPYLGAVVELPWLVLHVFFMDSVVWYVPCGQCVGVCLLWWVSCGL